MDIKKIHWDGGPQTPEKVDSLLQDIWEATHADDMEAKMQSMNMALLLGCCCVFLLDYKKLLEEKSEILGNNALLP